MNGGSREPPYANVHQFPKRKLQPWEVVYPASWQDIEPEPIKWLVKNCIPRGTVCLFSGDSGLGKSLLMQQLQTCAALGKPWLGNDVAKCRSYGFYCEDPLNILQLRQRDILQHLAGSHADLEDMALTSRIGQDNVLMDFNRRTDEGRATAVYDQLRDYVREFGAELIVIDTASHTFNGNENVRGHVTAFVNILQEIANETQGAVVLCSHPSVSSMQSGSGYSGSTAWRATVRAHMYLKRPKGFDDESDEADPNIRILKTMKANWGAGSGTLKLRWDAGVFIPMAPDTEKVSGMTAKLELDDIVLKAVKFLRSRGERIASASTARNNLPFLAGNLPSCKKYRRQDITNAVDRLIDHGKLVVVEVGPKSRSFSLLRLSDGDKYPGEGGNE